MRRRASRIGRLVLLAALLVSSAGCLHLDADLAVSADGTVTGSYVIAYLEDPSRPRPDLGSAGEFTASSGTATASRYDDGRYAGIRYWLDQVPIADLAAFSAVEMGSRDTGRIEITRDGNDFVVAGRFDFRPVGPSRQTPAQERESARSFAVRIRLTFPGEVLSADGTVDGRSVTWDVRPYQLTTLRARVSAVPAVFLAEPAGPGLRRYALAVGTGSAVLVLLATATLLVRSAARRRPEPVPVPAAGDPSDFAWVLGESTEGERPGRGRVAGAPGPPPDPAGPAEPPWWAGSLPRSESSDPGSDHRRSRWSRGDRRP